MELKEAMVNRHSIRGFLADPVSKDTMEEVISLAKTALSATNSQPWRLAVVTGEMLEKLRGAEAGAFRAGEAADYDYTEYISGGVYKERRVGVAKQLLSAAGVKREDKEGRMAWTERGFRFFDAPVLVLLMMDKDIDEVIYRQDMGCFIQNFCLAAMEYGLGTCVEYQAITYQKEMREMLGIGEDTRLVCGIAVGYPDPEFAPNAVVTAREENDSFTRWFGF